MPTQANHLKRFNQEWVPNPKVIGLLVSYLFLLAALPRSAVWGFFPTFLDG